MLFSRQGNTELVFDHFLDVFHQSCVYRKQAILILNHICEGIAGRLFVKRIALRCEGEARHSAFWEITVFENSS